jgi:DNA-binding ferritin-like protein
MIMEDFIIMDLREDTHYSGGTTVAARLVRTVADLYATMYLSHAAHWNVMGSGFQHYHALFKESYEQVYDAIDDTAEQARMMGAFLPRSIPDLLATSAVPLPASEDNVESHVTALIGAHSALKQKWDDLATNSGGDAGLNDLAGRMSGMHSKMMWKLRSSLGPARTAP